jgi:hypothetical protein
MPFLIGVVLGIGTALLCSWIGLDRRSFYATVLIVVGHYYVLFATIGASSRVLVIESIGMFVFVLIAAIGVRRGMWIIAAGLALHGAFDSVHGALVTNPGMPPWWPAFCGSYDVAAAIVLAFLIWNQSRSARVGMAS